MQGLSFTSMISGLQIQILTSQSVSLITYNFDVSSWFILAQSECVLFFILSIQ